MITRRRTAGVLLAATTALLGGCAPASQSSKPGADSGIGALPTFLPTPADAGKAHGSAAAPAMSYAGSPVVIQLGPGTVTVDVQGPSYPPDTKVGADAVRCTFIVVMSRASHRLDLARASFDVLDHNGTTHRLRPAGGGRLTGAVEPARTLTLRLATVVPSGEGLLRYAPDGQHVAAAWDYVAETD